MAPEPDEDTMKNGRCSTHERQRRRTERRSCRIAVCLMTYSHHAMRTECDAMTEHYYRLRDYALNHAECSAIMHIID
jgi:hypothetical protein